MLFRSDTNTYKDPNPKHWLWLVRILIHSYSILTPPGTASDTFSWYLNIIQVQILLHPPCYDLAPHCLSFTGYYIIFTLPHKLTHNTELDRLFIVKLIYSQWCPVHHYYWFLLLINLSVYLPYYGIHPLVMRVTLCYQVI